MQIQKTLQNKRAASKSITWPIQEEASAKYEFTEWHRE
ncbi:hypothetical protein B4158_5844 [Bacillus cereus]|nr:hypothetical protein B4158_5844 [Bacillus cereus]